MSVIVSKGEGVTVFTVTSNPKSKWPLFCQILGTLCCSPMCFTSQSLKQQLGHVHAVLGTLQIMVGLMNLAFGGIYRAAGPFGFLWDEPYWLGSMFIVVGIICIIADKFKTPCVICCTVVMNLVSTGLAITAIVLYSVNISSIRYVDDCSPREDPYGYRYGYGYGYYTTTVSPEKKDLLEEMMENCKRRRHFYMVLFGGLHIMMITLAVLQLCVTISSCVLSLKALCKKKKGGEMEDPELHKPLVEDELPSPAC